MAGAAQVRRPVGGAAPRRAATRRRERCPACGALAERHQLICLACGERIALEQKQTGGRPVILAVGALGAVALICVALVAGALIGGGDSGSPAPSSAPRGAQAPALPAGPDAAQRAAPPRAGEHVAAAIPGWPAGQAGWTVVVLGAGDRASAESFAHGLKDAGVDAGLISPEERPDTGTLWLVFSGVHPDQAAAAAEATDLRLRYPGAYARYVGKAVGTHSAEPSASARAPSGGAPAQTPPG